MPSFLNWGESSRPHLEIEGILADDSALFFIGIDAFYKNGSALCPSYCTTSPVPLFLNGFSRRLFGPSYADGSLGHFCAIQRPPAACAPPTRSPRPPIHRQPPRYALTVSMGDVQRLGKEVG